MIIRSPYPDVEVPEISLPEFVLEHADERGGAPAVIDGFTGRTLSYRDLATQARRVAAGLQAHGVAKGDVLALCSPNGPEFVVTCYAAAWAGAVVTTMNPLATRGEMAAHLAAGGARWLVTTPEVFRDKGKPAAAEAGVRETFVFGTADGATPFTYLSDAARACSLPSLSPDDLAILPYSSGTSGFPKGVMLTHRQLVTNVCQMTVLNQVQADDVVVAVVPMFHIYGLQVSMNQTLRAGGTLVTVPRFSADSFLGVLETYRVTRAPLVPPLVLALATHPAVDSHDLSSLRVILSAAAPLAPDLARACAEGIGCRVVQGYGMTELGGASHVPPDAGPDDPESIGPSLSGVECRVVDLVTGADVAPGQRGELLVRSLAAMLGYLNNPQATAAMIDADGWMRTGDIVTVDERGWFRVVDRAKELIKYKGYQVAPAELEAIVLTHSSVADCAVIASPDPEAGEVPKAFVVLRPGCTADGLLDWVAERVAPYQKIRRLQVTDQIPKSASGKILRRVLQEADRAAASQMPAGALS
jgi:acyl-CoA synthetase (AMP-forming)/AMP-acid ligase II